jgi:hypothetical protein
MADSPYTSKASEKRTSLAEMAARAAQRTSRPPQAPNTPPSSRPASRTAGSYAPPPAYTAAPQSYAPPSASMGGDPDGSGLINLSHLSQFPTLAPAVRAIDPRSVTPATPVETPALRAAPNGSRMVLAGVVVALVGIGVAYGLTSQNGSDAPSDRSAAFSEQHESMQANAVVAAPLSPTKVEVAPVATSVPAPVAALPSPAAEKVNPLPPGTVTPSEPTEITRAHVGRTAGHGPAKSGKARKAVVASTASPPAAATGPSPGAAAIAAAMAAEAPAAAPTAAPAPVAAPVPATPEPTGLAGAIKKAVGPQEPAPAPEKAEVTKAAPVRGDIPELPAQGAISGALGSPRTAARNCLAGQEGPSRATIVFASSGNVQSVTVTGPAAGTPAEACVKAAMSKTVVGAFKHPTFSVSTTISPP